MILRYKPRWLSVRHTTDLAGHPPVHDTLLILDSTYLQASVLGPLENLMLVQPVEGFGGILASCMRTYTTR